MAINEAGIKPEDLGYINAHMVPSTEANDAAETVAIKRALGDYAYHIPVSSTKSKDGAFIRCSLGAIEAIACIKSIGRRLLPPTIAYEEKR